MKARLNECHHCLSVMSHLVSIIMPAYNAENHIAASIHSVLKQTYAQWELIVVDDGSTDGTAAVVERFSALDARIKYIFQPNGGQASARNTGLRNSRGDLIAFLDADDLWVSEKLTLQIAKIEESGADVVFSDGFVFYDDERAAQTGFFEVAFGEHQGAAMFKLLFANNRIAILSVLARRNVLARVQFFDEDRRYQNCEDYELWLRLAREGAVFYGIPERLVKYRRHSMSTTYDESRLLKPMIAVIKKHAHERSLSRDEVKRRIRGLYRDLISALVKENRMAEANACMKEFADWDKGSVVTQLQRVLLTLSPNQYNFISRECLYRTEWHVNHLLGKSTAN